MKVGMKNNPLGWLICPYRSIFPASIILLPEKYWPIKLIGVSEIVKRLIKPKKRKLIHNLKTKYLYFDSRG